MTIKISEIQLSSFESVAIENYIAELKDYYREQFSYLEKIFDAKSFDAILKNAFEQAKSSGFTERGAVKFYIDMMIIFGAGFETDPQYSWIYASLNENPAYSQLVKMQRLFFKTKVFLDDIIGENNQYLYSAIKKILELRPENYFSGAGDFVKQTHVFLENIYPQKYQKTNAQDITSLIEQGILKAQQNYQLEAPDDIATIILLMFMMGHHFDNDVFIPWANRNSGTQPDKKNCLSVSTMAEKFRVWLQITQI